MDIRLFGIIHTKAPLSHISEAISTNSYLVQDPIIQEDGTIEEVFCYSGNAFRGQLRDLCSKFMLEYLGRKVNIDSFHLMFSGGKIGGDQVMDIEAAKIIRLNVPVLGIFGGGIGNQIIAGKMKFQNIYTICKEAIPVLPKALHEKASKRSYKSMTSEKSFTRTDDAKNDLNDKFINRTGHESDKKEKKEKAVSDQMRMTSELLNAGVDLYCGIDLIGVSKVEAGALISGFRVLARNPYIGGQSNKGHGHIDLNLACTLENKDESETLIGIFDEFIRIEDGTLMLSEIAEGFEKEYLEVLDTIKSGQIVDDDTIIDKNKAEKVVCEFWS